MSEFTFSFDEVPVVNFDVPGVPGQRGKGLVDGGTTDQALLKASNVDHETKWETLTPGLVGADPVGSADAAETAAKSYADSQDSAHSVSDRAYSDAADDVHSAEDRAYTDALAASLGTSSVLDAPAVGDAAVGEVVKGDDSRLTDARTPSAHTHTESDISDLGNYADATHDHDADYAATAHNHDADYAATAHVHGVDDLSVTGTPDGTKFLRDDGTWQDVSVGSHDHDADYATTAQGALADTAVQPGDLGTAAPLDVPAAGDAAVGEVVKGDDSRLTDSRTPTAHNHDADYEAAGAVTTHEASHAPADAITAADHALIDHTGLPGVGAGSGGAVDSVNTQTGVVVLDADDIDDSATTHKFATAAQLAAADSASQPGHTHTQSDVTDLPTVPDPSGEADGRILGVTTGGLAYQDAPSGGPDPTDITDGYVWTADGADGAGWEALPASAGGTTAARVRQTSAQLLPDNTLTALTFDVVDFDNGSLADLGTNDTRLTAPVAGKYLVKAESQFDAVGTPTRHAIGLRVNGTDYKTFEAFAPVDGPYAATGSTIDVLDLSAGDYVEVMIRSTDSSTSSTKGHDNEAAPHITMTLLSPASAGGTIEPVHASVALTADFSTSARTYHTVSWQQARNDTDSISDIGGANPERLTVPQDGWYLVSGTIASSDFDQILRGVLNVNGVRERWIVRIENFTQPDGNGTIWQDFAAPIYFYQGDYITVEVHTDQAATLVGGDGFEDTRLDLTLLEGSGAGLTNSTYTFRTITGTTHTFEASDLGKIVQADNVSPSIFTVPPAADVQFPVGGAIRLRVKPTAGNLTIAAGTGVTINTAESLELDGTNAGAELIYEGSDNWWLVGRLVSA